ncbi:hypothetical protein [Micromonospora sp. NPDC050695]|uniref:hypothetical protein n=1 Tax=Micromonospora sp. NPDC050695 TaxID=3154938 RepID=UPI0033E0C894
MDPISIAVTILAIYGMLKRSPQWAGEMAEEWRAAKRGDTSPAAQARRQRLIAAGVDPAAGGPMRQYVGNRWREHWLDADAKATQRRAGRLDKEAAGEALSRRERLQSRLDDETTRLAERWRTREPSDVVPPVSTNKGGDKPDPGTPDGGGASPSGDVDPPSTTPPGGSAGGTNTRTDDGDPDPIPDGFDGVFSSTVHDDDCYTNPGRPREQPPTANPGGSTPNDRDPIRVDATVGAPARSNTQPAAVAAITAGGTMSNAVAQQAVTGVVSGAAEARAIQAALMHATDEYVAQLNRLRARIYSLGEQTLGTVQMSGKSHVIANTAAAAEAAAAATANARACTSEVEPLLGNVARAFDRINS